MVSAMNFGGSREFNPFIEFTQLFPVTTTNKLPPLKTIHHWISPKASSIWVPKWRPSPSKFYAELTKQLTGKETLGRICHAEHDTNAVVLFVQAKWDDPTKPRHILDARDRHDAFNTNHRPLPRIEELRELVASVHHGSSFRGV